jgi:hypothetical protein
VITGYTRWLCPLPCEHRASFSSGLFAWTEPLDAEQATTAANSKRVIYAGFAQAQSAQVPCSMGS